jgi:transcriptional regulator with XRE-family HTH domain
MPKPPARATLRRAFARTVRALRRNAGISQEQLALRSGIERSYMSGLERGKHSPTLGTIYRLLPVVGVTFTEFAAEMERQMESKG